MILHTVGIRSLAALRRILVDAAHRVNRWSARLVEFKARASDQAQSKPFASATGVLSATNSVRRRRQRLLHTMPQM